MIKDMQEITQELEKAYDLTDTAKLALKQVGAVETVTIENVLGLACQQLDDAIAVLKTAAPVPEPIPAADSTCLVAAMLQASPEQLQDALALLKQSTSESATPGASNETNA